MSDRMSRLLRKVLLFGQGMEEKEKQAAISQLIADLRPFFDSKGFNHDKAHQSFRKRDNELSWIFGLGLFVHPDAFTIKPTASVRHESIERVFHRVSGAPDAVQRESVTVLWQRALEKRTPKPDSLTVDRSSRVPDAVAFTEEFFIKWVEPFFREHSSLATIAESYNEDKSLLRAKFVTDWFEILARALIAAKLAGRSDYQALKHEYRRTLETKKSLHSDPIGSFEALARILDENN